MSKLDDIKKEYEPQPVKMVKQTEPADVDINEIRKHLDKNKQPTKIQQPIKREDTTFTPSDKKKILDTSLLEYKKKKIRLRRSERKLIENMETDTSKNMQGIVIGLAIIGIIFIMLVNNFLPNEAMYLIIILIGCFMFIPVGMIVGLVLLDIFMRCKILRKVTRRNWGIVNFVGKGKRLVSKIKNFDNGLIWQEDNCWVLAKNKIFQMTKDGNAVNEGKTIEPDSILTLVDTVPVIFVDLDSMEPLSITLSGREPVYPSEIGSTCKAWMDIQRAKLLKGRKAMDILLIVVIICSVGAIAVSFLTMGKVDELTKMVQTLQNQITPPP